MNNEDNRTFKESVRDFIGDAILAITGSTIIIVVAVLVAELIFSLPE